MVKLLSPSRLRNRIVQAKRVLDYLNPADMNPTDQAALEAVLTLLHNIRKRQVRRLEEGNDPDTVRSTFCPPTVDEST